MKAVGEIGIVGMARPSVNAIHDATGVWLNEMPATPERVWRAYRPNKHKGD